MPMQQQANTEDTAVTRTDLVRLLQETGRPEPLDVSGQELRGITLINCNLEGANLSQARICEANLCGAKLSRADLHGADQRGTYLSWASLGGASTCEHTRSHHRRRGAIFRETTEVIVAERFSEKIGRYAPGFALGLPCLSVVSFLTVLSVRFIFTQLRLTNHPVDH